MTFSEFKSLVMPLAVQLGAEWDLPAWRLYHRAVDNIPRQLLVIAIDKAASTRTKFPSAAQLRELAEAVRQELIAANPYTKCETCNLTGWVEVDCDGVKRVQRCVCWKAHQQRLFEMGVTGTPLALPQPERIPQLTE